jgi:fructokinase
VALTRGADGSLLRTPGDEAVHPGIPIENIADTVGAGDCFTATLAIGLLRGDILPVINERANRRAAYVCTQPGAMPIMPAHVDAESR